MAISDYFELSWSNARAVTVGKKQWVFPGADVTVTPSARFVDIAPEAAAGHTPGGPLVPDRRRGRPRPRHA